MINMCRAVPRVIFESLLQNVHVFGRALIFVLEALCPFLQYMGVAFRETSSFCKILILVRISVDD